MHDHNISVSAYRPVIATVSLMLLACLLPARGRAAAPALGAGVWWVYQYVQTSDFSGPGSAFDAALDRETGGNFADPAFILYADDKDAYSPWHFSAEMRLGTGSFTDTANNNSADNVVMHKAWIARDLSAHNTLTLGKSQVPFGWKTQNFRPGDLLEGGYGDQMDVGLKLSGERQAWHYALAYYHQDDWGETSTDTVDDNRHWGSSTTYRKIKTLVANADYDLADHHTVGVSWQSGRMQDLAASTGAAQNDSGRHHAVDLHYYYQRGNWSLKYRYIDVERDFSAMDALLASCGSSCPADTVVRNHRQALHLGWRHQRWHYYVEGSVASTDTDGNNTDQVIAWAPGMSFKYGPGWVYLEYLWQNGDIDRYGDIYQGDFRALYASFDFYF